MQHVISKTLLKSSFYNSLGRFERLCCLNSMNIPSLEFAKLVQISAKFPSQLFLPSNNMIIFINTRGYKGKLGSK